MVHEGENDIAVEQKPFTLAGVRHIGQLMRGDVQLPRQNLPVTGSLVQHIYEVRVLEDVLYLAAGQEILYVLGDAGRNAAPFAEALPDFHGIGRCLLLLEKKVELVHIVSGGLSGGTIGRDTPQT